MKQNLIQMQLRLSQQKPKSSMYEKSCQQEPCETVDFTLKAFFVANQILSTDYLFSKRALITFLLGKQIILQQKNNQHPPSMLKGYMSHHDEYLIVQMIDLMIDLNILGEKKVSLKQRLIKRLFTTKKFEIQNFPKVFLRVKDQKPIQFSFIKTGFKTQNEKIKQKSRLSSFLISKTSLPVNIEKKQVELRIKTQKQKQQEESKKNKIEEQLRLKKQQQDLAIELQTLKELQERKKQQQRQLHINKMNDFWLREKQKIESFISPQKLKKLEKQKEIKEKQKQEQKIKNQQKSLQVAGNILQMQMKQLKEQEENKKNPIKPYISWSFVKNTLGIDSSQSNDVKKIESQVPKNSENILKDNDLKSIKEQPLKKVEIKDQFSHQKQQYQLSGIDTESTDVTMTNYKLNKINKNISQNQEKQRQNSFKSKIFAQSPQDSMFSKSYYGLKNDEYGSQTITNKKIDKVNENNKQKAQTKKEIPFSFKRRSSFLVNEETFTIAKKQSQQEIFKRIQVDMLQTQDQFCQKFIKRLKKQQHQKQDEVQFTKTMIVPRRLSVKRRTKDFMQVVFSEDIPKYQVQMFSQTLTNAEPKTKNKKVSTGDLFPNKSQNHEREIKRDSFVEELIRDFYKGKR